jgi:hypothetical protein
MEPFKISCIELVDEWESEAQRRLYALADGATLEEVYADHDIEDIEEGEA